METKTSKKRINKESNLRYIMKVEGITTRFIAERLGITPLFAQQCISRPERFSQSKRELLCQVLNRSYEEVFGNFPVRPQIMIARPTQIQVQQA